MNPKNNTLDTLRESLFAALKEARDTSKALDVERLRATCNIAEQITNTDRVEIDYMRITGAKDGSGFVQLSGNGEPSAPPAAIEHHTKNQSVQSVPGGNAMTTLTATDLADAIGACNGMISTQAAAMLRSQHAEIERLTEQNSAYRTFNSTQSKLLSFHRVRAAEYQAAVSTLDSEIKANMLLKQDVDRLKVETERRRERFDPAKFAHRPDCCGATIDTHCMGCTMAEQNAHAEEIATLRAERKRLRAALVGIVGDDDPTSMTKTRAVLAVINSGGSGDAIAAIDALLDIRP